MFINVTDSYVSATDLGQSSTTNETSSSIDGLLTHFSDGPRDNIADTSNVFDITSVRNPDSTSGGTTSVTSYLSDVTSVTNYYGVTDGKSTDYTIETFESGSSSLVVVAVVVPILVVIVVVLVVLLCLYRRRKNGIDIVRVWHVPRTHSIPVEIQKASWYEDEEESNGEFNPDLELQPNLHQIIAFGNDTGDELSAAVNNGDWRSEKDASFTNSSSDITDTDIENTEDKGIQDDVVTKISVLRKSEQSLTSLDGDYDVARHIGDEETTSKNDDSKSDINWQSNSNIGNEKSEKYVVNEISDEEGYIAVEIEVKGDDTEQYQIVRLRNKGDKSKDFYANVEKRNVKSMNEQISNDTSGLNLPKKAGSKYKINSRPPIAQPRVSKKKSRNAVPELPKRVPKDTKPGIVRYHNHYEELNADDKHLPDTHVSAANDVTNEQLSDSEHDIEDDIYDYPRNNSQVVHVDGDDDTIYKVPRSSQHTYVNQEKLLN